MEFLNSGASKSSRDVLNGAIFSESYRGLVLVQDIEFYSLCEHHMLPFTGKAHIAYLPQGKVIGLSKLPRLLAFERDSSLRQEFLASVRGVATEAHRRGPREVRAPGNAAVVPFPVTGEERQVNVHAGRPRTTRKGGTYPRRQAISAPRGAFDGEPGAR